SDEERVLFIHDPAERIGIHVRSSARTLRAVYGRQLVMGGEFDLVPAGDLVLEPRQTFRRHMYGRARCLLELEQRVHVGHVEERTLPALNSNGHNLVPAVLAACHGNPPQWRLSAFVHDLDDAYAALHSNRGQGPHPSVRGRYIEQVVDLLDVGPPPPPYQSTRLVERDRCLSGAHRSRLDSVEHVRVRDCHDRRSLGEGHCRKLCLLGQVPGECVALDDGQNWMHACLLQCGSEGASEVQTVAPAASEYLRMSADPLPGALEGRGRLDVGDTP